MVVRVEERLMRLEVLPFEVGEHLWSFVGELVGVDWKFVDLGSH